MQIKPYSAYIASTSALIGIPPTRVTTEVAVTLNSAFNSAMEDAWEFWPWMDLCPQGEARFVGNKIPYCNNLSKTVEWTATNLTITGDNLQNPLDGRITASRLLETVTNGAHSVVPNAVNIVPTTSYVFSAYVRPNGRSWVYLSLNDGSLTHSAFYNVQTGELGTQTNCIANIQQVANGFYLCAFTFTTTTSISPTASLTLQVSTDGSTLSYAGDITKGLYVWGVLLQQTTNTSLNDALVAYEQTGEDIIETVFQVYIDSPFNTSLPRPQAYELTPSGIQILNNAVISFAVVNSAGVTITTQQSNPVFVYYRREMPTYEGSDYDAADSYAVDDQVLFTWSDGTYDYWKCIATAAPGDTPETDPDKWQLLEIPDAIFWGVVWKAFSDWLTQDGQADKAMMADVKGQKRLDDRVEKESRQSRRNALPMVVSTHVSSSWQSGT